VGDESMMKLTQISRLIKKIKEVVILTANLFDLITIGYFLSFTNIEESWAE
jgi:hypothetical protein